MDPISQGAVGSAFAQAGSRPEYIRAAAVFGCLAGMAPDLDVFINSDSDPLLFLEYHRHFTHALLFIPVGALVVSAVLFRAFKHPLSFRQAYLAAFIGYATHGLLDACTSYGTQLLWPFTDYRVAWNNVSVVDPAFTLPLLVMALLSVRRRSRRLAVAAAGWALFYLSFGGVQHLRAHAAAVQMAQALGHDAGRLSVKPGFANLLVWKVIYEHGDQYHVNAVRVALDSRWCPGSQVAKLDMPEHFPDLDPASRQARDVERFRWFSNDYLAPWGEPGEIIDVRYAAVPNQIDPLWGIRIDPARPDQHAEFVPNRRATPAQSQALWALLKGEGCRPLS